MKEVVPFWIGGQHTTGKSSRRGAVTNPASGEVAREVAFATHEDVDAAVVAAAAAFPAWRDTPVLRRARILQKMLTLAQANHRELARLITIEHGKTIEDAMGSVQRGLEVLEFACGAPQLLKGEFSESVGQGIDSYNLRQPVGVCVGITPFNFPVMVPMWMFPMALACGNTFVLKPSEKVPSASMLLAALAHEAGLPPGVLNVVHGDKEAVDALLTHPQVGAISFVGSTPIARYIYETGARHGKRVQALAGAKNHAVVLPDCDLEFTAEALVGAAFGSAGERCMAISAVVAVGSIGDALVEKLAEKAKAIVIGPGETAGVGMGPLVTREHRDRVSGYVDIGAREGAKMILDGRGHVVTGHEQGFFLGTSLFDHVTTDMQIYKDEIFGPVLVVLRAANLDEAIALVNANPWANGTAIFTSSGGAARKFQTEIQVGMIGINVPIPVPMAFYSFGGWKGSLFGDLHVHGMEGVKFYTRTKVVTARWPKQDTIAPGLVMPTL